MNAVTHTNQRSIDLLINEDWAKPRYNEKIWKVVSLILFPIGIYQFTYHCLAKYAFSQFILASTSGAVQLAHKHKEAIEEMDQSYLHRESDGSAEKVSVRTRDGLNLDAVRIISQEQKDLPPAEQKWLIYILPAKAIWQEVFQSKPDMELTALLDLAKATGKNVLCVNYRATGGSTLSRPASFDDLFLDIESGLKTLKGVLPQNIKLFSISLGGTVALHLANKYPEIPMTIVQNAFQSLALLANDYSKYLIKYVIKIVNEDVLRQQELPILNSRTGVESSKKLTLFQRMTYSLKDAFLSLPHLVLRVTYFFFSFLNHLFHYQVNQAGEDLLEIGKTLVIDTVLTISGLISLPLSLFTNKINQCNGHLKGFYLIHSAIIESVKSPKFVDLAVHILDRTNWIIDNANVALSIGKDRLCIVQVPPGTDRTIPYEASLAKAVSERYPEFPIHNCRGHEFTQGKDHHDHMASPVPEPPRHETDEVVREALRG